MKKIAGMVIGILVLAGIAGGIYFGMLAPKSFETARVSKNDIQEIISGTGNLESNRIEDLSTEDVIEIQEIFVRPGDKVKAGEALLKYKKVKISNSGKETAQEEELELTAEFEGVIMQVYAETAKTIPSGTKLLQIADCRDMYAHRFHRE